MHQTFAQYSPGITGHFAYGVISSWPLKSNMFLFEIDLINFRCAVCCCFVDGLTGFYSYIDLFSIGANFRGGVGHVPPSPTIMLENATLSNWPAGDFR